MATDVNAERRRREVVAQAAELFDRAGYHTTNVAALAEAAGLRKATLYHYFAGKDEILFLIHEEFIDLLLAKELRRRSLPPADALLEVMVDVLELMRTHRGHVRVFFEHHRELSPGRRRRSAASATRTRRRSKRSSGAAPATGRFATSIRA